MTTFSSSFHVQLVSVDTDDEELHLQLVDSFLYNGRVTNVKRLLSFHVQYLNWFNRTESYILQGEGPLPFDWRYYIGILVSEFNP